MRPMVLCIPFVELLDGMKERIAQGISKSLVPRRGGVNLEATCCEQKVTL